MKIQIKVALFLLLFLPLINPDLTGIGTVEYGAVDSLMINQVDEVLVENFQDEERIYPDIIDASISSDWIEGESVHTTLNFANAFVSGDFSYSPKYGTEYDYPTYQVIVTGSLDASHRADSAGWQLRAVDDPSVETPEYAAAYVYVRIPALTSGTLYWEHSMFIYNGGVDWVIGTGQAVGISGTTVMDETALTTEGYLEFYFIFVAQYRTSPGTSQTASSTCYRTSGAGTQNNIYSNVSESHTSTNIIYVSVCLDQFYYVRDDMEADIRSEYRRTSDSTNEHRLFIENFEYGTQIDISKPTHWNISYITPTATTTLSVNDIQVTDTIPVTYEVGFHSTSKQYLAISTEKSYDMEGELPDHQIITSSTGYDGDYGISGGWSEINYKGDNTLNSTIVSNGVFSLRMDGNLDSPNYRAYLGFYVPYGEYYFSFDYYVESSDGTLAFFEFFIADSGTVVSALTLDQTANRWHKGFAFGNCKYTYYSQAVVCVRDTSDFVVFFDNIKFWQVNHEVFTSGYQQIKVSGQMISWDGYDNPAVPNEEIELEIRDRTADSSIVSDSTKTTDSNGNFEWIIDTSSYSELQDQREIEVRSYSLESWFGFQSYDYFTEDCSATDWIGETFFELSTDAKTGTYSAHLKHDTGSLRYGDFSAIDVSNCDYFVFWEKWNQSGVFGSNINIYTSYTGADYFEASDTRTISSNVWNFRKVDIGASTSYGEADLSSIISWGWWTNTDFEIYLDSVRFLQAQKSYFTPLISTDFPYYYETDPKNNEFDFSEETSEGISTSFWNPQELSITDGYMSYASNGDSNADGYYLDLNSAFDESIYSMYEIRIKANTTSLVYVTSTGSAYPASGELSVTTSWQVFHPVMTSANKRIGIFIWDTAYSGSEKITIDIIRIVCSDTPSLSVADSYAWCSSSNNSYSYRTEIDDTVQGYYSDLVSFGTDQIIGSHTINCTVFDDSDRTLVFLPGTSVTSSYTVTDDFTVTVGSYYLSDSYVNIYVTASKDCSYTIYENDSSSGSGSVDKDGTAIAHARTTDYGSLVNLAYEFVNSTDSIWFNTSYSNSAYTQLIVSLSSPILVDGRISISVFSNLGGSEVYIDDDSKAGIEVNWENEGVFSWYSNIIGENNITIQVRKDCNGDSDTTDTGETWSDTVSYHLYDDDLTLVYYQLHTFTDEGATFTFMSNYRGSAKTEYRCKTQDELGWSGWISEDTYNGTYDFTFVNCDLDTTYNFSVEIRAYITDEIPAYQYKYLRMEYTPYSEDPIVQNPQGIDRDEDEDEADSYVEIRYPNKTDFFVNMIIIMLMVMGIMAGVTALVIVFMKTYYENRKEEEPPIEFASRYLTEKSVETAEEITKKILQRK